MNLLLPPKTWKDPETQERWQRLVSLVPSTRERVRQLQETFDLLMIENQARQYPICPVRGKFFLQLFDEIIRQVACDCPERAVLLVRVRDEIRLRIETYQTLYHNR
jgi:dynein light intermediate chain